MTAQEAGTILLAIVIFVASGVCEIGGGWLVWKWRRDGWNIAFFFLGCLALIAYGILPTLQEQPFGRTYAAYGGLFILLALLWGWAFEASQPDLWDWVGAALAVAGACVIFFIPRPAPSPTPGSLSPSPSLSAPPPVPAPPSLPTNQNPSLTASPPRLSIAPQPNGAVGNSFPAEPPARNGFAAPLLGSSATEEDRPESSLEQPQGFTMPNSPARSPPQRPP